MTTPVIPYLLDTDLFDTWLDTTNDIITVLTTHEGAISGDATSLSGQPASYYLNRSNHTGTQTAATISNFNEAVDDRVGSLLIAGTGVSILYDDGANTITISTAGISDAGTLDGQDGTYYLDRTNHTGTQLSTTISDFDEAVDDRVGALVIAGTGATVNYDDVANTLTVGVSPDASQEITTFVGGTMTDDELLFAYYASRDLSFDAGVSTNFGHAIAKTAATAETILPILYNSIQVGTITFAAAGTTGTIDFPTPVTITAADQFSLDLKAPATADATLADVSVTLLANVL